MKNVQMKFLLRILIIMILFQLILMPSVVKAFSVDDVFRLGDNFLSKGNTQINREKLSETTNVVYSALVIIGVALTVIIGGVLGIQFMMASAEEKAKIKEKIIPFILGCIVIYGSFAIWKITVSIFDEIA